MDWVHKTAISLSFKLIEDRLHERPVSRQMGLFNAISHFAMNDLPSTTRHIDSPISTRSPVLSVQ